VIHLAAIHWDKNSICFAEVTANQQQQYNSSFHTPAFCDVMKVRFFFVRILWNTDPFIKAGNDIALFARAGREQKRAAIATLCYQFRRTYLPKSR
jgi:hypothetical protein